MPFLISRRLSSRAIRVVALAVLVVASLVVGAWHGAVGAETPTPSPGVSEILSRAEQQFAATKSVHFNLRVNGQSFLDTKHTLQLLGAQGDIVRPDKASLTVHAKVENAATVSIKLIAVGGNTWWTNLVSGKWEPAPTGLEFDPTSLFDSKVGIGAVMAKLQQPKLLGSDKVDGHATYHVQAQVPASVLAPLTINAMTVSPVTVDLWIDEETFDLRRIQLAEPERASMAHPATWELDLSRQNKPVTIEAPAPPATPQASPAASPAA